VPASRTDTRPVVAAFDVDGTLTTGDRVTPFLWRVARWRLARTIARHPLGVAAALRRGDNDRLKALATKALAGVSYEQVLGEAEPFAREIPGSILRADTGARLRRHRELGHRVVLVSASYEVYLRPLGALLGVDGVIGTRLEVDASGRCTGRLDGLNCRGPEKLRRLREWLHEHSLVDAELWAYGDSAGDAELLTAADHPVWVRDTRIGAEPVV
jgi:phosphatidylglycerophosphatase C